MSCNKCVEFECFEWCLKTREKGFCNRRKQTNGKVVVNGTSFCQYFEDDCVGRADKPIVQRYNFGVKQ